VNDSIDDSTKDPTPARPGMGWRQHHSAEKKGRTPWRAARG